MKKLTFIVMFFFVTLVSTQAQYVFNKGDFMFNAGIGLPAARGMIPTLNASAEIGVIPTGDIGIVSFGGETEIQFTHWVDYYNKSTAGILLAVGPRAAWHLQVFESDMWDVYGGAGFGLAFGKQYHYGDAGVYGYGEAFIGGRMMFKENFGIFAELGGGNLGMPLSFAKFGLTLGF